MCGVCGRDDRDDFRIYNIKRGRLGVFVSEGCGEFYDLSIKRNSKDNRERQGRNERS